jgi:hypothetical protein
MGTRISAEDRRAAEGLIRGGELTPREIADRLELPLDKVYYIQKRLAAAGEVAAPAAAPEPEPAGGVEARRAEILALKGLINPGTGRPYTQEEAGAVYGVGKSWVGKIWGAREKLTAGEVPGEARWRLALLLEILVRPGPGDDLGRRVGVNRASVIRAAAEFRELGYDVRAEGGGAASRYVCRNVELVAPPLGRPLELEGLEAPPAGPAAPEALPVLPDLPEEPGPLAALAARRVPDNALPEVLAKAILFDRAPALAEADGRLWLAAVAVGDHYRVSPHTVRRIWQGERWQDLQDLLLVEAPRMPQDASPPEVAGEHDPAAADAATGHQDPAAAGRRRRA